MAKTKPRKATKRSKHKSVRSETNGSRSKPDVNPKILLDEALSLLHTSQPQDALVQAERALSLLQSDGKLTPSALPALQLLGEINVELGDVEEARKHFTTAASLDPEGLIPDAAGGGAEKFLWLAQLCEDGGSTSIEWYERGATVLRKNISEQSEISARTGLPNDAEEKKQKLATALCGMAEVFMTDLSWEDDAEERCERLVTEALLVAPESPDPLQTLASIRISQEKHDDARKALSRSMLLWKHLEPDDPKVPAFPTRISLSRLLMEVGMEEEAIEVLERLITEDDSSVEAWYLGGWCLHLLYGKSQATADVESSGQHDESGSKIAVAESSRDWLTNSLNLYQMLDYEDERLRAHATELVEGLDKVLGPRAGDDEAASEGQDASEWEDEPEDPDGDDERMDDT